MNKLKLIAMKDYLPARLCATSKRWYILWYQTNPVTLEKKRHRETFSLGRIPVESRLKYAKELIDHINSRIPFGYPFDEGMYETTVTMTAKSALKLVLELSVDLRHATIKSYESSSRKFEKFLANINLADKPISMINKKVAFAYSDHLTKSGLTARSHNNDINEMKRIFNLLKSREILTVNPFDHIPRRKVDKKHRLPISDKDCRTILDYLKYDDISVYLSCLLLYFCFIRPNEQRQLKRSNFNLDTSLIHVPADVSKNRKDGFVTIPAQLKNIMMEIGFDHLRPGDYILGSKRRLGQITPVGKITMGNRYRDILRKLHKEGKLASIKGNTIYSWKDTGGDALAKTGIDGVRLKDQFRHHSLDETQTYLSQRRVADDFILTNHVLK